MITLGHALTRLLVDSFSESSKRKIKSKIKQKMVALPALKLCQKHFQSWKKRQAN
jgi:hypothetical protein